MNIVNQSYAFLQNRLLPMIAPKHKGLFAFGFEALTLRPYISLNGNARMTVFNRNTAETKIYRLVSNSKLLPYFSALVSNLHLIKPGDCINVDFSTFCGFEVLTFAKQTNLGRAIPLCVAAITYPINDPGSQTLFVINEIKKFVISIGFTPTFIFDRGFESPFIIAFLLKESIPFIVRVKQGKFVVHKGLELPLKNLPWFEKDTSINCYNQKLRIVVSEKKQDMEEPWYLLTNILVSSKEELIASYYFRFEIEETFKDLKHILDMKTFYRIKKKQTFSILLWFYILSIWLSFLLKRTKRYLAQRAYLNKHKKLSIVRFFAESIQLELFKSFKKQFF